MLFRSGAVANRISQALSDSLRQAEVTKRLAALSFEPIASTPAELASLMKVESERWAKVIRSTGAKPE